VGHLFILSSENMSDYLSLLIL